MIQGDSVEYHLLAKWSNFDCDGHHSCEIGVRDGMGSKIIMDNIKNNYIHTGVDPYANLNYQHYDQLAPSNGITLMRCEILCSTI
jgi:hypothetical protein